MQNNVTELTQRLLRSLDSNYNVINLPAVIEIISLLEKVVITKELLETTRLGKYINELRKKTTDDSLSKRAKELVKKWRNAVLPESNGQIKQSPPLHQTSHPLTQHISPQQEDPNQLKAKKRPAKEPLEAGVNVKRVKLNGGMSELDFSDNSNSSFKDVIAIKTEPKRDVIIINSDSNSSMSEKHDPHLDQQMPKKRGRKKGSKNHKNLIDEAESSFTSKLAVSRGNSKVKTTQELIASLQSKNSNSIINSITVKPKEDLMEKAAKLTERVSIIDQQLNTNSNRTKNSQRNKFKLEKNERVIESGSVINDKSLLSQSSSLIKEEKEIDVIDAEEQEDIKDEIKEESQETENNNIVSLSVEDALKQLPPIDKSVLFEEEEYDEPRCSCILKENKTDFSIEEDVDVDITNRFEFIEDPDCQARRNLREKYQLDSTTDERVRALHTAEMPNVNGNLSLGPPKNCTLLQENGLYVNIVPNVNIESVPKDVKYFTGENYSRYSFSETSDVGVMCSDPVKRERTGDETDREESDRNFREWHEVIELPSYSGEILKILPYVIID